MSKQCTAALKHRSNCYTTEAFASELSDHSTQTVNVAIKEVCHGLPCIVLETSYTNSRGKSPHIKS